MNNLKEHAAVTDDSPSLVINYYKSKLSKEAQQHLVKTPGLRRQIERARRKRVRESEYIYSFYNFLSYSVRYFRSYTLQQCILYLLLLDSTVLVTQEAEADGKTPLLPTVQLSTDSKFNLLLLASKIRTGSCGIVRNSKFSWN